MSLRKFLLPVLTGFCAGILYSVSADATIQFVSEFKRPPWWHVAGSLGWSILLWGQVTHLISVILAAVPVAFALRYLPLSSPVAAAVVAAMVCLAYALNQLVQLMQSPVGDLLDLSEPLVLSVLVVDHVKLIGALPFLVWLLVRSPSNHSLQGRRP